MSNILSQDWLLSRRHFLRGCGTVMALPLLDAMTPLFAAASATAKPRRSVFVYIPNGVNGMAWQVTKSGRGYELSPSLEAAGKAPRRLSRSSAACTTRTGLGRPMCARIPGSRARRLMRRARGSITTRSPATNSWPKSRRNIRASLRWNCPSVRERASRTTRRRLLFPVTACRSLPKTTPAIFSTVSSARNRAAWRRSALRLNKRHSVLDEVLDDAEIPASWAWRQ